MMKPKFSHAAEKSFTICCISGSLYAQKEQSSAYRSSRKLPVFNFILTLIRLVLKRPPSARKLSFKPHCLLSKASLSVALSIMLKRFGVETNPCFNQFETRITSDVSLLNTIMTSIPSWHWRIIEMNSPGHKNVFINAHSPPRQTVSKAFEKSTKVSSRLLFCF